MRQGQLVVALARERESGVGLGDGGRVAVRPQGAADSRRTSANLIEKTGQPLLSISRKYSDRRGRRSGQLENTTLRR